MKADLHCHSTYSDGVFSPSELVHLAKQKQFDVVAITDHDTIAGYTELKEAAQKEGLMYLTGIEISSVFQELSVHVLGYAFEEDSSVIHEYQKRSQEARRVRAKKILEKLRLLGVDVSEEEVFRDDTLEASIGRPHIARIMVEKKYGSTIRDIFDTYLGDKKPAYVPSERVSVQEAVSLIHKARGFAVIAHPHLYRNKKRVLQLLDSLAFDGIEALYCRFPERENEFWIRLAQQRKLLITGGSDFHGERREDSLYGCSLTPDDTLQHFLKHMHRG